MNNSNLRLYLVRFRDMMDYWSNFRCRKGVPLLKQSFYRKPRIQCCKFGIQKLETSLYRVVQAYFDVLNRVTDGRADRQTDFGITNVTLH